MVLKIKFLFPLLLVYNVIFCQDIITDTLFVDFNTDSLISNNYLLDTIVDNRNVHSRVVSFSQTKKYILIPVDQEICLKKPLYSYLTDHQTEFSKDTLQLRIDYFIIEKYKGRFFSQYQLLADFPVYKLFNGSPKFMGTLVYKYEFQPENKRTKKYEVIEELLPQWHRQFKIDMLAVNNYFNSNNNKPDVLIEKSLKKPYFLNISSGGVIGYNFWQIEAELYLTRPETSGSRWFQSRVIRYQHTNNFESIGYGSKSEHFNYRFHDNWQFDISSNFLLGFLKWKNPEEIKLYQLIQLSVSSNQSLIYNKKNQAGFIYKMGLFQNVYYIAEHNPGIQIGVYFATGYSF